VLLELGVTHGHHVVLLEVVFADFVCDQIGIGFLVMPEALPFGHGWPPQLCAQV
jgi:hypothetical protein